MTSERLDLSFFYKLKFENLVKGDKSVIDWCMREGLIASFYKCPVCKGLMKLTVTSGTCDGYAWRCRSFKNHSASRSIRKGSCFESSHLSLVDALLLTYMFIRGDDTANVIHELRLGTQTLCQWRSFYRDLLYNMCMDETVMIGGPDKIVELDDRKLSRMKHKRKKKEENWVLSGIERGSGSCFLAEVATSEADTLRAIIQKYVHPGTTIVTDGWASNVGLEEVGYRHQTVKSGAHINTIEATWGVIKRKMPTHSYKGHSPQYLAEYMWKKRRPKEYHMRDFICGMKRLYPPKTCDVPEEDSFIAVPEEVSKTDVEDVIYIED